jgi:predicted HAD superfamily phosphohydrolase YqeG
VKWLATRDSMSGTAAQVGSRFLSLVGRMKPTWHLPDLAALTPDFAGQHGITGFIWDVDGTLTAHHGDTLSPAAAPFTRLLAMPGARHAIVSNAPEARYERLGVIFPDVVVIRGYSLGDRVAFRRLLRGRESWSGDGDGSWIASGARPLRKPSGALVRHAAGELGCDLGAAVMIGDQYLTDVAGAALAGVRSIKLPTIEKSSFPRRLRIAQQLERSIYLLCYPWSGT